MDDLISRQALMKEFSDFVRASNNSDFAKAPTWNDAVSLVGSMPSAQQEQRWIPFTTRPLTEEEKEEHSEWDSILDCELPDDGQRILVSVSVRGHERVQYDEFYTDDGCYLDSGYEIVTEAVAWMPLPEPYKEDGEND